LFSFQAGTFLLFVYLIAAGCLKESKKSKQKELFKKMAMTALGEKGVGK
jgi:hypothetical protein